MRYAGGVDVGSTQTKAVVIDEARRIVGRALIMTGANVVTAAQEAFQAALDDGVVREADVDLLPGVEGAQARVLDVTIRKGAPGPFTESRWELWAEPLPSVCLGGDR